MRALQLQYSESQEYQNKSPNKIKNKSSLSSLVASRIQVGAQCEAAHWPGTPLHLIGYAPGLTSGLRGLAHSSPRIHTEVHTCMQHACMHTSDRQPDRQTYRHHRGWLGALGTTVRPSASQKVWLGNSNDHLLYTPKVRQHCHLARST